MTRTLQFSMATLIVALLGLSPATAQTGGLKEQAAQSQAKVDTLTKDIDQLSADIEEGIQEVVTLLASVRDSTGTSRSGTSRGMPVRSMLVDAKHQAILALLDAAQDNQRRLLALEGQLGKVWGTLPDEEIERQIAALESKIETRIDQLVAIAASLTRHEEDLVQTSMVKRPGSGSTRFRKRTTNPDYILNQRVSSVSEPIRRRVAEELAADGERLQRKILKTEFNLGQVEDAARREAIETDLEALREQLAKRERQFETVATDEQPDTKAASLAEAETIQRQAHDKVKVIEEKQERLLELMSRRDLELSRLQGFQTRLQFLGGM